MPVSWPLQAVYFFDSFVGSISRHLTGETLLNAEWADVVWASDVNVALRARREQRQRYAVRIVACLEYRGGAEKKSPTAIRRERVLYARCREAHARVERMTSLEAQVCACRWACAHVRVFSCGLCAVRRRWRSLGARGANSKVKLPRTDPTHELQGSESSSPVAALMQRSLRGARGTQVTSITAQSLQ